MSRKPSVITLLTDFGNADYFVGAMKGVILGINPQAQIVDITHKISPQDIEGAALMLLNSYRSFPSGTVHIAVVDPGVGSRRRAIAASAAGQFFVGPDNGLFSYVLEKELTYEVIHLTAEQYFRHPVSQTFQGRDLFGPVGAAISNGTQISDLGELINDRVRLPSLAPSLIKEDRVDGRIIHIDNFGNCMTNFSREHLEPSKEKDATIVIGNKQIKSFRQFYGDVSDDKLFAIWGSAGFLEIAVQNDSAAEFLNAALGQAVTLTLGS